MTISQTNPGELVDARPLGSALAHAKHSGLIETETLKVKRMVLLKDKELAQHKAPGEITVQCLEGRIAFSTMGKTEQLEPGHLIYLPPGELHSVRAIEDSSFLLTIVFNRKN